MEQDFERVSSDESRDIRAEWDELEWAQIAADAELDLIESGIAEQSEERARTYLATYGDAAWERVDWAAQESRRLLEVGSPSGALALAAIAAEISLRFLVVRPLVAGSILSDILAEYITMTVVSGRTKADRDLLPLIGQHWSLGLNALHLADGSPLLPYLTDTLWAQRDHLMHRGQEVTEVEARQASEAVTLVINGIVRPMAKMLRMSWPHERWSFPNAPERSPFVKKARP